MKGGGVLIPGHSTLKTRNSPACSLLMLLILGFSIFSSSLYLSIPIDSLLCSYFSPLPVFEAFYCMRLVRLHILRRDTYMHTHTYIYYTHRTRLVFDQSLLEYSFCQIQRLSLPRCSGWRRPLAGYSVSPRFHTPPWRLALQFASVHTKTQSEI